MKNIIKYIGIFLLFIFMTPTLNAQDWANTNYYKTENENLGLPKKGENRVVFMGNSITQSWASMVPDFFTSNAYINRGISGQTTPQMLIRFRPDVIDLHPKVVVILAGTNDIAGNTGPTTLKMISGNIFSMAELAKANGIKVILCSVLPAYDYPWKPGQKPAEKIVKLNTLIKNYAIENKLTYVDYFSEMVDTKNGLKNELTSDGVHPNIKGYHIMAPIAKEAILKVLK